MGGVELMRTDLQKLSDKQEARVADLFGGRVNPGSGSNWKRRQDVRVDEPERLLIEAKRTGKTQVTVKADDWKQLRHHAALEDRTPLMAIELDGVNYIMMREVDFL